MDRLILGDAGEELPRLPDACAQVVIADPPYHNVLANEWDQQWRTAEDYVEWTERWVEAAMRVLRPDGLAFIFGQPGKREHAFLHVMSRLTQRHQFHDLLIWDRVVGYNERRDSFTPAYEMIFVLRKSDSPKFRKEAVRVPYDDATVQLYLRDKRYRDREARLAHLQKGKFATNILSVPSLKGASTERCGHPSQKPLALIRPLIECSTDPGDVVLDPFVGSGTTAVAAKQLGRHFIGIERNEAFIEIARQRVAQTEDLFTALASKG